LKVLDFLSTLKEAIDLNHVSEGVAGIILTYLLTKDVERFDFEACLRVRAFQFSRESALHRELFQFLDEVKAAK
jgi:hypothetical protein